MVKQNSQLCYMEPKNNSRPLRCGWNEGKNGFMNKEENYTARLIENSPFVLRVMPAVPSEFCHHQANGGKGFLSLG